MAILAKMAISKTCYRYVIFLTWVPQVLLSKIVPIPEVFVIMDVGTVVLGILERDL